MDKKTETDRVQEVTETRTTPARTYFDRLFDTDGKTKNIDKILLVAKWALYGILLAVVGLIVMEQWEKFTITRQGIRFVTIVLVLLVLAVAETQSMIIPKKDPMRMVLFVLKVSTACITLVLAVGTYSFILYVLVWTTFYMAAKKMGASLWLFGVGVSFFVLCYIMQIYFVRGDITNTEILRELFASLLSLLVHYIATQFVMAFYWQYIQLNSALEELDRNKQEMEKSYEALVKVAALEERQRIAKELHDTAGHSLTTVIMQTEAAKRVIDTNVEEAKNKLISANLQAKHTLERLRESVHLLSGTGETASLKMDLEQTVNETTDGTGIHIRSMIQDIMTSREKHRFIVRALKEGLSNGIRHGEATAFWFELKQVDGKILFFLSDNGKGLCGKAFQTGFGLLSMSDRVKDFGGRISFVSEEDEGFEISFEIPAEDEE